MSFSRFPKGVYTKESICLLSSLIQTLLSAPGSDRISFRSRAVPPVEITLLEEICLLCISWFMVPEQCCVCQGTGKKFSISSPPVGHNMNRYAQAKHIVSS